MPNTYIEKTIEYSKVALLNLEVPIACIYLHNGKTYIYHNQTNALKNPLAHAELLNPIENSICYVNVEPCGMCMSILKSMNIHVYYACRNYIFGGNTVFNIGYGEFVEGYEEEIVRILKEFYGLENGNAPDDKRKIKSGSRLD